VPSTFSSNIKAAIDSWANPIAIDQNVIEELGSFFDCILVMIIETARLSDDAKVKIAPIKKSELKSKLIWLLVEKIKIVPPIIPKLRAMYFNFDSFSLRNIRPKKRTARGEVSIIAADKLDDIYFRPVNCIGYNIPNAEVPIQIKPSHCEPVRGTSIFCLSILKAMKITTVANPNLKLAAVNGSHASKVYFEAKNVVPHRMFAIIAKRNP